jgi:hypothetical protein
MDVCKGFKDKHYRLEVPVQGNMSTSYDDGFDNGSSARHFFFKVPDFHSDRAFGSDGSRLRL